MTRRRTCQNLEKEIRTNLFSGSTTNNQEKETASGTFAAQYLDREELALERLRLRLRDELELLGI